MANTIDYGLKFNTKDLERMLALSKQFEKIQKQSTKTVNALTVEKFKLEKTLLYSNLKYNKKTIADLTSYWQRYYTQVKGFDQKTTESLIESQKKIAENQAKKTSRTAVVSRVAKYIGTSTLMYGGYAAARRGITAIHDYDQALQNTYAALGNVTEAEKQLIRTITQNQALTDKYGKSFAEIATAMEVLAKAGLSASESMMVLEPALGLASIAETDVGTAVEYLTESLMSMGRPLSEAGKLANLLAEGAQASTIDVKDLAESMKIAGATGTSFGMTMEEIVRWMSAAGTTGLKGRNAANAMARDFLRITKEADKFKKVGVDVFDPTTKKLRSFIDILKDVANAELDITEKQKLLGIYAFKSNEQLMRAIPQYEKMLKSIGNNNDALKEMVDIQMEGLNKKADMFKKSWDNLFITQGWFNTSLGATYDLLNGLLSLAVKIPKAISGGATNIIMGMYFTDEELALIKKKKDTTSAVLKADAEFAAFEISLANKTKEELQAIQKERLSDFKEMQRKFLEFTKGVNPNDPKNIGFESKRDAYFEEMQRETRKNSALRQVISLFKKDSSLLDPTKKGESTKEETYDSLKSFYEKMFKLQNDAQSRETTQLAKQLQDNKDLYQEHLLSIELMTLKDDDRKNANESAKRVMEAQDEKAYYDERIRNLKELQKLMDEGNKKYAEQQDEFKKREHDLRMQYDVEYQLEQFKEQRDIELLLLNDNEQAKFAIKEAYAQKTMDLLATQYEKEHQISSAFWRSINAGSQAFVNGVRDMDDIWKSFRDSFISSLIEMTIKYIAFGFITNILGGFNTGLGAMVGNIFGVGATSFGGGGGGTPGGGAVYGSGGFVLNTPPNQRGNGNSDVVDRLVAIERRIASGNAQTVKALEDNRPVVEGKFIGEPEIYTMSKNGERKRKFITK